MKKVIAFILCLSVILSIWTNPSMAQEEKRNSEIVEDIPEVINLIGRDPQKTANIFSRIHRIIRNGKNLRRGNDF